MSAEIPEEVRVPQVSPRKTPSILLLYLPVIIDYLGVQLLQPVMNDIVEELGRPDFMDKGTSAGALYSAFGGGQLCGAFFLGFLSDHLKDRKLVLMAAVSLSAVFYVAAGFSVNYWMFLVCRVLLGVCAGSRAVILAYISDIVPYKQMPKWAIVIGTLASVAAIAGPPTSGYVAAFFSKSTTPLFVNAGLCVLTVTSVFFFLKSPQFYVQRTLQIQYAAAGLPVPLEGADEEQPAEKGAGKESQTIAYKEEAAEALSRALIVMLAATALAASTNSFNDQSWQTLFPIVLKYNFGKTKKEMGLWMIVQGVVQLVVCLFVYVPFTRLTSVPFVMCVGCLLYCSPVIFPLLEGQLWYSIFMGCLLKTGATLVGTSGPIIMKLICPSSHRGKVNGLYVSCGKFLAVVAPLLIGGLYDVKRWLPFMIMGLVAFMGLMCATVPLFGVKKFEKEQAEKAKAKA